MKKKFLSSFVLMLATSGIFFLFNFVLAKMLGAEDYGKIVYYTVFIQIVMLLISLNYAGLYMGVKILQKDKNTFNFFITLESILFILISLPAFWVINFFIKNSEHTFYILTIAYTSVILITASLEYTAQKKVSLSIAVGTLIPRILLSTIFLLFVWLGYAEVSYYLYIYLFANILVVFFIFYRFKPSYYTGVSIFQRAWKFYLLGLIGMGFTYIAQIVQKEYSSYADLAALSIAILFISSLSLLGSVLVKFALPKIHQAWRENEVYKIEAIYQTHTLVSSIINLPILFYMLWNMDIFATLLGEGYTQLAIFFYILSIGYLFDLLTGITGSILRATEHESYEIYNELVRFISGAFILILWHYDDYVVAYAISGATLFYNISKYIQIYRLFRFRPIQMEHIKSIILHLTIFSFFLYGISNLDKYFSLGFGVVGLLLYYGWIYAYFKNKLHITEVYQ